MIIRKCDFAEMWQTESKTVYLIGTQPVGTGRIGKNKIRDNLAASLTEVRKEELMPV